jgi:hypothetical protein
MQNLYIPTLEGRHVAWYVTPDLMPASLSTSRQISRLPEKTPRTRFADLRASLALKNSLPFLLTASTDARALTAGWRERTDERDRGAGEAVDVVGGEGCNAIVNVETGPLRVPFAASYKTASHEYCPGVPSNTDAVHPLENCAAWRPFTISQ